MKILFAAIALTIAIPAAAQTAQPAVDPHAGHTMPADHSQPGDKGGNEDHKNCCDQMKADGKKMECCDEAKAKGSKMACCDKKAAESGSTADPHAGHDMSKK